MDTAIEILVSLAPSLIVSIVMAVWERRQKQRDEAQAKRDREAAARQAAQDKAQRVQLDVLMAAAALSYATAMALKRGHPNGEVETAIDKYNTAVAELQDYERELMTRTA